MEIELPVVQGDVDNSVLICKFKDGTMDLSFQDHYTKRYMRVFGLGSTTMLTSAEPAYNPFYANFNPKKYRIKKLIVEEID